MSNPLAFRVLSQAAPLLPVSFISNALFRSRLQVSESLSLSGSGRRSPTTLHWRKQNAQGTAVSQIQGEERIEPRLQKAGTLRGVADTKCLHAVIPKPGSKYSFSRLHLLFPAVGGRSAVDAGDTARRKDGCPSYPVGTDRWRQPTRGAAWGPLPRGSATTGAFAQGCSAHAEGCAGRCAG